MHTPTFEPSVVTAVLSHMNNDHLDDSLIITRAFVSPTIESATMTGFDGDIATWSVVDGGVERTVTVDWPGAPLTERMAVRQAVVALYEGACERLGLPIREH